MCAQFFVDVSLDFLPPFSVGFSQGVKKGDEASLPPPLLLLLLLPQPINHDPPVPPGVVVMNGIPPDSHHLTLSLYIKHTETDQKLSAGHS